MQSNKLRMAIRSTVAVAVLGGRRAGSDAGGSMKIIQERIGQGLGFLGVLVAVSGAPAAMAVEVPTASGVKLDITTQGKFQPTYFSNFDLDSNVDDGSTGTSAGAVQVGDEHVRAEVRLGVMASGENWTGKLLLENDFSLDANSVDRAYRGERFGLEQAFFTYTFDPAFTVQGGWTFKNLDLASGGLLYGDDHPLFGATGKTSWGNYDVYWMPINDGLISNTTDVNRPTRSECSQWRAGLGCLCVEI